MHVAGNESNQIIGQEAKAKLNQGHFIYLKDNFEISFMSQLLHSFDHTPHLNSILYINCQFVFQKILFTLSYA